MTGLKTEINMTILVHMLRIFNSDLFHYMYLMYLLSLTNLYGTLFARGEATI